MKEGSSRLTLIEVKYRNKDVYGATGESITHHKQARLRCTAAHSLCSHREHRTFACRFEIIGLIENLRGRQIQLTRDIFYYWSLQHGTN